MSGQRRPDTLRVLVVDPLHDAADSLAMVLSLYGFEARTAYSLSEAVRTAAEFRPHVVLSEFLLPGGSGEVIVRAVRAAHGHAVFVAVTTAARETDRARSRQAGFALHLVKPVDPDELLGLLATHRRPPR